MELNRATDDLVDIYPIVREKDGYILNPSVLRDYKKIGVKLVITVDFGISNPLNFRIAKEVGLRLVVCDHHETTIKSFSAPAVDPKRGDSQYPFRQLAGVGVTFKLAQSLYQSSFHLNPDEFYNLKKEFFPLLLIGSIADRVPLLDENRIFCQFGLKFFDELDSPWLNFFSQNHQMKLARITSEVIPILGSAAYADPNLGVGMLVSKSAQEVEEIAEKLKRALDLRKRAADKLFKEALSASKIYPHIVIAVVPFTKQNYLGPVASRLKDYFKKTTIIIAMKNKKCFGELRSLNLDLYKMLYRFRNLFIDFGGHKKAAGFSMPEENLDTLISGLISYTSQFTPEKSSDNTSPEVFLDRALVSILSPLTPFGEGNPAPVLVDRSNTYTIDNGLNIIELEV
jgi:single-stranded-DNA-specific exonuclease